MIPGKVAVFAVEGSSSATSVGMEAKSALQMNLRLFAESKKWRQ